MNNIRLATIIPNSEANGPGNHFTIWVQGCSLNCPGCFNKSLQDKTKGTDFSIEKIVKQINQYWIDGKIRGLTITGGEPLQQTAAILKLIKSVKQISRKLGIILLTGYYKTELEKNDYFQELTSNIDVLIAGRFDINKKIQEGLRGSSNKEYYFFSSIYTLEEFDSIPPTEVFIDSTGEISLTGINPTIIRESME